MQVPVTTNYVYHKDIYSNILFYSKCIQCGRRDTHFKIIKRGRLLQCPYFLMGLTFLWPCMMKRREILHAIFMYLNKNVQQGALWKIKE